jgi:uncharacterized phage protein (TIGR01671 family)
MREIKFFAYVNNPIHGKGVFPVKSIHFEPFVCEVDIWGEIVNFFDFDEITLLEYTGLKDRNGQEIYEGDIIEEKYNDEVYRWIVRWNQEYACFYVHEPNIGEILYMHDFDSVIRKGEVIGNVYENIDLLEAK